MTPCCSDTSSASVDNRGQDTSRLATDNHNDNDLVEGASIDDDAEEEEPQQQQQQHMTRSVSFDTVRIHEHAMILG